MVISSRISLTFYLQASSLYKRLQWLEQHLEKLLLSRKRGRPGVRGRREHNKVESTFVVSPVNSRYPFHLHAGNHWIIQVSTWAEDKGCS